jgi:hypothetical protein
MPRAHALAVLFPLAISACRPSQGPPLEVVRQVVQSTFERAARGEPVPVKIPFTGEGPATPKLLQSEINPLTPGVDEDGAELYHYDVRLTYLNRIRQMENASYRFGFVKKDGVWMPWYPSLQHPLPRKK